MAALAANPAAAQAAGEAGKEGIDKGVELLERPEVEIAIAAIIIYVVYKFSGFITGVADIAGGLTGALGAGSQLLKDSVAKGSEALSGGLSESIDLVRASGVQTYTLRGNVCEVIKRKVDGVWYKDVYTLVGITCNRTEHTKMTDQEIKEWEAFLKNPVIFYSSDGFGGNYMGLKEGKYPSWPTSYEGLKVEENGVYSMKIDPEYEIALFSDRYYTGYLGIYNSDVNLLIRFESFMIGKKGTLEANLPKYVKIYEHPQYKGVTISLPIGEYPDLRSAAGGKLWINAASSIEIPEGITVTLYADLNFIAEAITVIGPERIPMFNGYYNRTGHIGDNDLDGLRIVASVSGAKPLQSWSNPSENPANQPKPPPELPPNPPRLILYNYPNYQGLTGTYYEGQQIPNLSEFAWKSGGTVEIGINDVDSLIIEDGLTVEFYNDLNFTGVKMVLVGPLRIPDLATGGYKIGRNDIDGVKVFKT